LPVFTISHRYGSPGYYPVRLHAVDAAGNQTYLQLAALIRSPGGIGLNNTKPGGGTIMFSRPGPLQRMGYGLWLAWTSYIVVMLMAVSFWLGERREYFILTRRATR